MCQVFIVTYSFYVRFGSWSELSLAWMGFYFFCVFFPCLSARCDFGVSSFVLWDFRAHQESRRSSWHQVCDFFMFIWFWIPVIYKWVHFITQKMKFLHTGGKQEVWSICVHNVPRSQPGAVPLSHHPDNFVSFDGVGCQSSNAWQLSSPLMMLCVQLAIFQELQGSIQLAALLFSRLKKSNKHYDQMASLKPKCSMWW